SHCATFTLTQPATTAPYPLSLHDALPIFASRRDALLCHRRRHRGAESGRRAVRKCAARGVSGANRRGGGHGERRRSGRSRRRRRSEEHTSELQSRGHLVCRLLLEKKKRQK